jgi:hypothetical protein
MDRVTGIRKEWIAEAGRKKEWIRQTGKRKDRSGRQAEFLGRIKKAGRRKECSIQVK